MKPVNTGEVVFKAVVASHSFLPQSMFTVVAVLKGFISIPNGGMTATLNIALVSGNVCGVAHPWAHNLMRIRAIPKPLTYPPFKTFCSLCSHGLKIFRFW